MRNGFYSKERLSVVVVIDECAPEVAKNVLTILFGPGTLTSPAQSDLTLT